MNRLYKSYKTHNSAKEHGFIPIVSPKKNKLTPWNYDKEFI